MQPEQLPEYAVDKLSLPKNLAHFLKTLHVSRIELHMVNRETLVVKPKEPFIQWVINNLPHEDSIVDPETKEVIDFNMPPETIRRAVNTGHSAYLLPATDSGELEEATLRAIYKIIFERELRDWSLNEKNWPKNRSYELFLEWFDFTYHDSTYDLCQAPLERELLDDTIPDTPVAAP